MQICFPFAILALNPAQSVGGTMGNNAYWPLYLVFTLQRRAPFFIGR